MVLLQIGPQVLECLFRRVRPMNQVEVVGRYRSRIHQRLKVDDLVPILLAIHHHADVLGELLGLRQGEQLEHFVERPKAPRKHHQRLGQVGEPQLAHEEVVELEVQVGRDVRVGNLLEGQIDVQPDGLAASLECAAVGRFHDARSAAGANHKAVARLADGLGPFRDQEGQLARGLVIARHFEIGLGALQALLRIRRSRVPFCNSCSAACACSWLWKRADPKNTMVS